LLIRNYFQKSLEFHVKNPETRLSEIFGLLVERKKSYLTNIEDYIISEISLEDIFLSVAEGKDDETYVQV
jgi:hypothetical protein